MPLAIATTDRRLHVQLQQVLVPPRPIFVTSRNLECRFRMRVQHDLRTSRSKDLCNCTVLPSAMLFATSTGGIGTFTVSPARASTGHNRDSPGSP